MAIGKRTLSRRVLAKVLSLVSAEETGGLDLGSRSSGKFLVEADNALHADSIRSSADSLVKYPSAPCSSLNFAVPFSRVIQSIC